MILQRKKFNIME